MAEQDERVGHGASLATADQASDPSSSRCRKASRLRVDSPRETRQAHSFRIDAEEAEGQQLVEDVVARREDDAEELVEVVGVDRDRRHLAREVDVAVGVDGVGEPVQPQVLAQQGAVERLVVLVRVADDERAEARRPVAARAPTRRSSASSPRAGSRRTPPTRPPSSHSRPTESRYAVRRASACARGESSAGVVSWARRSRDHRRRDADEALALVDRRLVGAVGPLSAWPDGRPRGAGRWSRPSRTARRGRRPPIPAPARRGPSRSSDSTASVQSGVACPSTSTPASPTAVGRPPTWAATTGVPHACGLDGDETEGLASGWARATRSAARYHCASTGRGDRRHEADDVVDAERSGRAPRARAGG